jgi:branched-subunit amino acid transport protein
MRKLVNYFILPLLSIVVFTLIFQKNSDESLFESIVISTIITVIIIYVTRNPFMKNKK